MNFDECGSNGRVKLICQYTVSDATGYAVNVLILGGWIGEMEVKQAWTGHSFDDIEISSQLFFEKAGTKLVACQLWDQG